MSLEQFFLGAGFLTFGDPLVLPVVPDHGGGGGGGVSGVAGLLGLQGLFLPRMTSPRARPAHLPKNLLGEMPGFWIVAQMGRSVGRLTHVGVPASLPLGFPGACPCPVAPWRREYSTPEPLPE